MKYLERLVESGSAVVRSAVNESSGDKLELLWAALVCFKYIRYMSTFVKSIQINLPHPLALQMHYLRLYPYTCTCIAINFALRYYPNVSCRPVEKSCLIKFQDLFDVLKDVLCPPHSDEDDPKQLELETEENQQLQAGVESFQQLQQQQRTPQLLLLYSQCLSSFVTCFSHSMKERERERERVSGEPSLPATHVLEILK